LAQFRNSTEDRRCREHGRARNPDTDVMFSETPTAPSGSFGGTGKFIGSTVRATTAMHLGDERHRTTNSASREHTEQIA
jgi:hypothetical protein